MTLLRRIWGGFPEPEPTDDGHFAYGPPIGLSYYWYEFRTRTMLRQRARAKRRRLG